MSGGPFGIEPSIRAAGNFYAILGKYTIHILQMHTRMIEYQETYIVTHSFAHSLVTGFIVFPFVWAVPEALVTAELGAAFQDPSAGLAWVEHAFGERMGGLNGYFGWLSGALGTHCFIMFSCLPVWKGTSSCALTHDDFAIHTHTTADNAIYPTLFIEYVSSVAGWGKDEFGFLARFCSIVTITVGLAFLNYTGLEIVGNASLVICIIAMSPLKIFKFP